MIIYINNECFDLFLIYPIIIFSYHLVSVQPFNFYKKLNGCIMVKINTLRPFRLTVWLFWKN